MSIADLVSRRSTCDRAHVGCVLTINNRIISTGYNGSLSGLDHCDDVGHLMVEGHCVRTVHAEGNALADAARRGVATVGSTCYCTHSPCVSCLKLLVASGVTRIVFELSYGNIATQISLCEDAGVSLQLYVDSESGPRLCDLR